MRAELLIVSVVVAIVVAHASVLRDVWTGYRAGRRSLATAISITCITLGMIAVFTAVALEQGGPAGVRDAVQKIGIGLVLLAGLFGGVGLVLDRRLRNGGLPHGDRGPDSRT